MTFLYMYELIIIYYDIITMISYKYIRGTERTNTSKYTRQDHVCLRRNQL